MRDYVKDQFGDDVYEIYVDTSVKPAYRTLKNGVEIEYAIWNREVNEHYNNARAGQYVNQILG